MPSNHDNITERGIPVAVVDTGSPHDDDPRVVEEGTALCLSGGGYRAMLFHLGALWRLNQLGYLKKLARVSSVSGGSITAGVLGFKWNRLSFDGKGVAGNFDAEVVQPIRGLAGKTIDEGSIIGGIFLAFAALNVLLLALVTALVDAGLEPWLASVIVGVVIAAIGFVLVRQGMKALSLSKLAPQRTAANLQADARVIRDQVS